MYWTVLLRHGVRDRRRVPTTLLVRLAQQTPPPRSPPQMREAKASCAASSSRSSRSSPCSQRLLRRFSSGTDCCISLSDMGRGCSLGLLRLFWVILLAASCSLLLSSTCGAPCSVSVSSRCSAFASARFLPLWMVRSRLRTAGGASMGGEVHLLASSRTRVSLVLPSLAVGFYSTLLPQIGYAP